MASENVINLLDRVLTPVGHCLTPEAARRLIDLRAEPAVQQRVNELADRNTEGLLTPEEREEYEAYVTGANIIATLQSKARAVLRGEVKPATALKDQARRRDLSEFAGSWVSDPEVEAAMRDQDR